jgi:hypothetical protein
VISDFCPCELPDEIASAPEQGGIQRLCGTIFSTVTGWNGALSSETQAVEIS